MTKEAAASRLAHGARKVSAPRASQPSRQPASIKAPRFLLPTAGGARGAAGSQLSAGVYFVVAFSASSMEPGAQLMAMKPFEPIMLRSGKLTAMRNLPASAYTLPPETSIS